MVDANPGGAEHGTTAQDPSLTENKNGIDPKDNKKNPEMGRGDVKGKKILNMLKRTADRGQPETQNDRVSKLRSLQTKPQ